MCRKNLFCLLIWITPLFAQLTPVFEDKPIHEAFMSEITDLAPQAATVSIPPPARAESPPMQPNPQTVWIPGYWHWSQEKNTFIWVCGVWRKPPPNHFWVPGYWLVKNKGWVWIKGYWASQDANAFKYYPTPPPNTLDEKQEESPGNNYFWVPGFWQPTSQNQFQWYKGKWQLFDFRWILIPTHYEWRPEGYVFIPMYWDWPIERRGTAYECTTPPVILEPTSVLQRLYTHYPNYLSVYNFYWHFHRDWWKDCLCAPPWWEWQSFWGFPFKDQWNLWWWWTHPSFPAPFWMNEKLSNQISPPSAEVLDLFGKVPTPPFITTKGVPSTDAWLDAIQEISKGPNRIPLLPFAPKLLHQIHTLINDSLPDSNDLRPQGISRDIPIRPLSLPNASAISGALNVYIPLMPESQTIPIDGYPPEQIPIRKRFPKDDIPRRKTIMPPTRVWPPSSQMK